VHYYTFNIGDYRGATAHLSNEEDLAYRRLLDMYYDTEQKIPLDTHWVARRIRVEAFVIVDVLNDMFEKHEDGWFHARCHEVIGHYHAMAEKNRANGKLGGRKKNPVGNPVDTHSEPIAKATNNQEPITNNQRNTNICPSDGVPEMELPDCKHTEVIGLYHQHLPTLRKVEVWNAARQGYLRQRWREVAAELSQGKQIQADDVLTWWADFFRHVGRSKFLTGKVNSKDGRVFTADLEWILKPSNFAKIVEGKYHGTN
jgi:uncharacterized protein YdaU (DUF1376 family)